MATLPLVIDGRHLKSGLGTYTSSLVPLLIQELHPQPVVILGPVDQWEHILAPHKVKATLIEAPWPLYSMAARFKLPSLYTEPSVWWCPQPVVPFFLKQKLVVTIHDLIHRVFPDAFWRQCYKQHLLNHAVKQADEIVTVSAFSRAELLNYYPTVTEKVTIIHNGITKPHPCSQTQSKSGPALIVSNFLPHKNIPMACAAFLEGAPADKQLAIIGHTGRDQPEIAKLASASQGRISLMNSVDNETLSRMMHEAPFVLCPSLYEGFGMVALEAVSCGTPALATAIPAHCETLGKEGTLMESTPASMSETIKHAYNGKLNLNELQQKQEMRLNQFTWERSAETLSRIIRCAQNPRRRNG